ncbi:Phage terminase, large subunit GpA [Rhodoblastus acidophilus]|uniref:Phage terminase, large subunit GpA n=2 Tax=Rhodoblastus acidophilus TaxID=1074 RepID=A0A212RBV5_RHOAC|nr:Phage terminase, large subunit GpA [Rhodoblastus acidophilus]
MEDVNYQIPRGLDRSLFLKLGACDWIAERRHLLITGAAGLGKSWLACALGHKACREKISVLYTRMPRLFADLAIAHGDARYSRLLRSIARAKLLILDDWGPEALTPEQARDLLEIVEDRYDKGSLIITSQVPVDRWHDMIGIPTLPYLAEIMDCLSIASPVERVVFMKGAQTGGTEAGLNAIGYWIAHAPGIILTVWPSLDMVRRNSRTRIEPLIEGTPALRSKIAPARAKDPGNTLSQKEFTGGSLVMTGANSATGLRSLPARYLVMDEVDAFPADADGEGDPVALAVQRTVTFRGRRKILMISTPTDSGVSRIEKAFIESDQRRYFVPCPHCQAFQTLKWAGVKWPEGEPRKAFYACEVCGGVIEEADKPAMLAAGEWRATAPENKDAAGFHLSALYSPFEAWGEIAVEFLAARRDPLRLKPWTNTKLGEPFEDRDAEALDAASFISRLEGWGETLPEGVLTITAGVDVQNDRLALEIVGWGVGEESWSLQYDEIWGDPSKPDLWATLDAELLRAFEHPRAGRMHVRAACIDSGGHHTQTVYRYAQERAGRSVWAIKGRGGRGIPVWPRRPPRVREKAFTPYIIGVDAAKEIIVARLRGIDPGPGYCHFPLARDLDYFRQLGAERQIRTYRKGVALMEWRKDPAVRNEALDCRVYAFAALQSLVAKGLRLGDEAKRFADMPKREPGETTAPGAVPAKPRVIKSAWMSR